MKRLNSAFVVGLGVTEWYEYFTTSLEAASPIKNTTSLSIAISGS